MKCPCCGSEKFDTSCPDCGHPNCEAHGTYSRLAQTAGSKEGRPWSQREKYMLYAQGFGDGAKFSAMKHPGFAAYERGYADGRRARSEAVDKFCREIGHKPSVLRLADASDDPVSIPRQ
jgi:hypothetical protein